MPGAASLTSRRSAPALPHSTATLESLSQLREMRGISVHNPTSAHLVGTYKILLFIFIIKIYIRNKTCGIISQRIFCAWNVHSSTFIIGGLGVLTDTELLEDFLFNLIR